jgi:hypothetical protein
MSRKAMAKEKLAAAQAPPPQQHGFGQQGFPQQGFGQQGFGQHRCPVRPEQTPPVVTQERAA